MYKPKRSITTGANGVIKQSEFLEVTCRLLKALEKSRVLRESESVAIAVIA